MSNVSTSKLRNKRIKIPSKLDDCDYVTCDRKIDRNEC